MIRKTRRTRDWLPWSSLLLPLLLAKPQIDRGDRGPFDAESGAFQLYLVLNLTLNPLLCGRQAGRRNVQEALLLSQNTEYQNRIKIGKRRLQAQANNLIIGHRGWINLSFGTKDNLLAAVPWYCCSLQSAPWLCDLRSVQKSICKQKGQSFVLLPLLMMVWMIITRNGYTRD